MKAEFCSQHAEDGMVNVRSTTCSREGCSRQPTSFGSTGSRKAELCPQHAKDMMGDGRCRKNVRPAACHFEKPVSRSKRVKLEVTAKKSNDDGHSRPSRIGGIRQSEQDMPSESRTTRRAKLVGRFGGLVPAEVACSTTTVGMLVCAGGTNVKSEVTVSQYDQSGLTTTPVVASSHDGGSGRHSPEAADEGV